MDASTLEASLSVPHLLSPGHLMLADGKGKLQLPPHLAAINRFLVEAFHLPNSRLIINMPRQHGKTHLCTRYFASWALLLWPDTRIVLGTYSDDYGGILGGDIREIIQKWGPPLGIHLRQDTKAKNEWRIAGHDGGLVAAGRSGGLIGRPADLLLLDDLLKNDEEAMSPTITNAMWAWYKKVAYGCLGPRAPIISVGTRWTKRDWFGRVLEESKDRNEKWSVLKFKAITESDDPLGRTPGEALWEWRCPLSRHQDEQKTNFWFRGTHQQEPVEEEGLHFQPIDKNKEWRWPQYSDANDAWVVQHEGMTYRFMKYDCTTIVTADWAWSEKQTGDFSAVGAFVLTPTSYNGKFFLLVLDVENVRVPIHKLAPLVASMCRKWKPHRVAIESGHPSLKTDVRSFAEIPEVLWLDPQGKSKMARALPAIDMGGNNRIALPQQATWLGMFVTQLMNFTGMDDDHDDMVDMLAWAVRMGQNIRPAIRGSASYIDASPVTAGKEIW